MIVGARDGTVAAISTSTGKQVWSRKLGGSAFDPALDGGLVFVTSAAGTLSELAETSGALKWNVTLGAKPNAPAAYDPAKDLLVVGENDGAIVALSGSSGAQRWTFKTGGAINAAPDISGGTVYAGSSDGSVYALTESTGKKLWSYKIGSAVADTGVVMDELTATRTPALLIGADNGKLYALVASSGKLSFTVDMGGAVKGCGSAKGLVVCDTSKGTIGASRSYTFLKLWSYKVGAAFAGAPALVNGAIYVAGTDGSLYAFTPYGQPPV